MTTNDPSGDLSDITLKYIDGGVPAVLSRYASLSDVSLAHTESCASQHFAPWMIEEHWFRCAIDAVKSGTLAPKSLEVGDNAPTSPPYKIFNGVAVVSLAGPIMKARSKYGGASSVDARRAIRKAVNDDDVKSILLHIDSPGGTVAGTADLAADVKAADAVKPVYAHIDDLGASAAYWVASQARRITCNSTGRVGSIGTLLVLDDTSGMYAAKGIKVHVISTGEFKGAGTDGTAITAEQLKMFQEGVDDLNAHFLAGVSQGRKMPLSKVRELADGRVHIASKAKDMGLIDEVASLDAAMNFILDDDGSGEEAAIENQSPVEPATESPSIVESPEGDAAPALLIGGQNMADSVQPSAPAQTPAAGDNDVMQGISEAAKINRDTIQTYIDRGRTIGRAEGAKMEQDRMRALMAAAPGRPEIALNGFLAGHNEQTVSMIANIQSQADAKAKEASAALEVENARLQNLVATGGHPGVSASVFGESRMKAPEAELSGLEPEAQAKMEWDSDSLLRAKNNNNEKAYMLYRVNQLKGNVRVLRTA